MLKTTLVLWLIVLCALVHNSARCKARELEPNNLLPYATKTGTLPAATPQTVCGTIWGPDEDWWAIKLDYQTSGLVETEARLTLKAKASSAFLRLRLYEKGLAGGIHYLGSWSTIGGWLDTGPVALCYYKSGGLTTLWAAVDGGPASTDYFLSFW